MFDIIKFFDSRGTPTICAYTKCKSDIITSVAPAGKSTGSHEVLTYPIIKGIPNIGQSFKFFKQNKKSGDFQNFICMKNGAINGR